MADRLLSLREELVNRLENIARREGRSVDDVVAQLIDLHESETAAEPYSNWALAMAERMEQADIEWQELPDLSTRSSEF